ncbi:YbhB/YbcL family Raf kinase inhibitor-like protein [Helicobacter sp. 11S02596-1]|uniref:YbhB/YbcL family Raf kinase inhibitor-like protein n=1 Tax=Helicobacter sp. 11S02596-1 TaxID=1476194 RepID=UPI000BA67250|nr:YbhB/YbcL family Raf kinase inhibitor-like protein [Helicobacter sp. 11S02596-1]PAF44474.1 phospholipid-binding protein [Helicobacter sp. 11S02596-1]
MQCFEVKMELDNKGFLPARYGGNAPKEFLDTAGLPDVSPKISWESVDGAKSYALEIIDYDACYVCGKVFVHWVVGNIAKNALAENASWENKDIIQGVNSMTQGFWRIDLPESQKLANNIACSKYVGPMPPDKDHHYLVNVYALDIAKLSLSERPFFINHLHDAMRGHIIGLGRTEFLYAWCKR